MTLKNGKSCKRCGTREWYSSGTCKKCASVNHARWRKENPEKHRENVYSFRRNSPDKAKAIADRSVDYQKEYQQTDSFKKSKSDWWKRNLDKKRAYQSKRRTRKTKAGGSFTAKQFKQLCEKYNNRCLCCGYDDVKLTADHIVPVSKGGSSDISNIQPLCRACNSSKGANDKDYR